MDQLIEVLEARIKDLHLNQDTAFMNSQKTRISGEIEGLNWAISRLKGYPVNSVQRVPFADVDLDHLIQKLQELRATGPNVYVYIEVDDTTLCGIREIGRDLSQDVIIKY